MLVVVVAVVVVVVLYIYYLYCLFIALWKSWSQFQQTLGQGTSWTGHQSITEVKHNQPAILLLFLFLFFCFVLFYLKNTQCLHIKCRWTVSLYLVDWSLT